MYRTGDDLRNKCMNKIFDIKTGHVNVFMNIAKKKFFLIECLFKFPNINFHNFNILLNLYQTPFNML